MSGNERAQILYGNIFTLQRELQQAWELKKFDWIGHQLVCDYEIMIAGCFSGAKDPYLACQLKK